jgi:antitoxin (DNA-binding transcriptional repressor) of toxin-antitoxin stability system
LEKEAITKTVDVRDAQAQLPELLTLALEGSEVIISEGDKRPAHLVLWQLQNGNALRV